MPARGRPRLTPEALEGRIAAYCRRYGVTANPDGLPPFPAGKRETPQHREWIAVYKAHRRLARRRSGQCERCPEPAASGSLFCEAHRAGRARGPGDTADRRKRLATQRGRCPLCGRKLELEEAVDDEWVQADGALLHAPCATLVRLAEAAGPGILERLRAYLWPAGR